MDNDRPRKNAKINITAFVKSGAKNAAFATFGPILEKGEIKQEEEDASMRLELTDWRIDSAARLVVDVGFARERERSFRQYNPNRSCLKSSLFMHGNNLLDIAQEDDGFW